MDLREIVEGGGEASICEASFVDGLSDGDIEALFRSPRDDPHQPARAPLAQPVPLHQPGHRRPPCRRLQPFFPSRSFSAALSSIASRAAS